MAKTLCFSCNARPPKCDTIWQILLTFTTILLLILSVFQIIALGFYSDAFANSTSEACCGIIEQYSYSQEGAVCHERDIINKQIEKQVFNGSTLCIIADEICETYSDATLGSNTTLEDCLNTGNYPLTALCGEEQLKVFIYCVCFFESFLHI